MFHEIDAALPAELFRVFDLTGVFCNGIIGGRLARSKRFDAVGFVVLAIMSAMGGGIMRDVMLIQVPIALTDPYYIGTALAGALVAFLWRMDSRPTRGFVWLADSLVLGTWAATGAAKTLGLGFGILPALLMGLVTAVGGGMIRDVASGLVPTVFGGNNLYATPAAVSASAMIVMYQLGLPNLGMLVAIVFGLGFAGLASWRRWVLPAAPEWQVTMTYTQMRRLLKFHGIKLGRGGTNPDSAGPDLDSAGSDLDSAGPDLDSAGSAPDTPNTPTC
ncbi:MAG: trimeric intracellular cation channel family protein [Varibaculum sp.]|nr:trimeric intracellular cation channel family protein [Varibaculum sp.]